MYMYDVLYMYMYEHQIMLLPSLTWWCLGTVGYGSCCLARLDAAVEATLRTCLITVMVSGAHSLSTDVGTAFTKRWYMWARH